MLLEIEVESGVFTDDCFESAAIQVFKRLGDERKVFGEKWMCMFFF